MTADTVTVVLLGLMSCVISAAAVLPSANCLLTFLVFLVIFDKLDTISNGVVIDSGYIHQLKMNATDVNRWLIDPHCKHISLKCFIHFNMLHYSFEVLDMTT